jgi:myo-inositol-1(or 4)-monophosphatase
MSDPDPCRPDLCRPEVRSRYDLALEIAAEAGQLALAYFRDRASLEVEAKGGAQDLVSEADRAVERLIRERVSAALPGDGFLGEEYGYEQGTSGFIWVIDPIDGTSSFLHGLPNWCTAIAVLEAGACVAAVTVSPPTGEIFAAQLGGGLAVNGKPVRIAPDLTLANGITGIGASPYSDPPYLADKVARILEQGGMFYRNGSGALMLAYAAAGRLAGYFESVMYPWDCLGGLLMIREAGGLSLPLAHDPLLARRESVLVGAPAAWEDLKTLFAQSETPH